MKKDWIKAIVHLIFWAATTWLITSSFSIQSREIELIDGVETVNIIRSNGLTYQILLCIIVAVFLSYLNIRIIYKLNQPNTNEKTIWYSALLFLLALLLIDILTRLPLLGNGPPLPKQIAFGIIIFYFALSVAYGLARLWFFNVQRHQQLVLDKKQTELTLLRNQLQPHFLFNALNNLLSMVRPAENPKLVDSFERLSQLLRYVIEETKTDKVSMNKEINFLKNYIELQLLRFNENEVIVQFDVEGEFDTQKVEPGLFITFVENAFKYGTEPEKTSIIKIQFDLTKPDAVGLEIKNKVIMKNVNVNGTGTGIESTRKRLDLIYPGKYQLLVSNADDFVVELNLETR